MVGWMLKIPQKYAQMRHPINLPINVISEHVVETLNVSLMPERVIKVVVFLSAGIY